MARKKCCSRGPNIGKAIGESQTQTNRIQVVPIPGQDATDWRIGQSGFWEYKIPGTINWVSTDKPAQGPKGDGVNIKGSVASYNDLLNIIDVQKGDTYVVDETGLMYVYGDNGFPSEDKGVQIRGTDGITPQLRGNTNTKTWEASYDGGVTWVNLGVPYSGSDGDSYMPEYFQYYFDNV